MLVCMWSSLFSGFAVYLLNVTYCSYSAFLAARIWSPYKELYHTVTAAVVQKQPDAIQDLAVILRKQKPDFISLLRNPVQTTFYRNVLLILLTCFLL